MDNQTELTYYQNQLTLLRTSINKLLANAHVEHYAAAGNTMGYRSIEKLREEEVRLCRTIQKLEQLKAGKSSQSIMQMGQRVR